MTEHGSASRYSSGCRCERCRLAHNERTREFHRRKMRALDPNWTPDARRAKHGTNSKYVLGCRCVRCTAAHREYRRVQNYRDGLAHPKVDAEIIRPVVACMIGFGVERQRIAAVAKISPKTLRLRRPTVQRAKARAIERLHWSVFMASVEFRKHCRCPMPEHIQRWIDERESRAERLERAGIS